MMQQWIGLAIGVILAWAVLRAILRWVRAMELRDRVILITGGSRGLGLVLARFCLRAGAHVAICGRDGERLERAREELERRENELLAVRCDVAHPEEAQRLVEEVLNRFGRIDVLINNAGVLQVGPQETMTVADYEEAMGVHFWGPLHLITRVVPEMRRQGEGRIVNIASLGGKISLPHMLPYVASKFALAGFSQGLREELRRDGILVTTVFPGLMNTGSPRNADFKGQHRKEYAWFSISDALPGLSMPAERAARQILWACRNGDAQVILSMPAVLGIKLHALFPVTAIRLLTFINRILPGPGGIGQRKAKGSASTSRFSPSWWTTLGDRAASRNNENGHHPKKRREQRRPP